MQPGKELLQRPFFTELSDIWSRDLAGPVSDLNLGRSGVLTSLCPSLRGVLHGVQPSLWTGSSSAEPQLGPKSD